MRDEHPARSVMHDIVARRRITLAGVARIVRPPVGAVPDEILRLVRLSGGCGATGASGVPEISRVGCRRRRRRRSRRPGRGSGTGSAPLIARLFRQECTSLRCSMSCSICRTSGNSSRCASWSARPQKPAGLAPIVVTCPEESRDRRARACNEEISARRRAFRRPAVLPSVAQRLVELPAGLQNVGDFAHRDARSRTSPSRS